MIIVRLMGGLGNQMFQYAAGLRLAMHHSTPLKVDLNTLLDRNPVETHVFRDFDLPIFKFDIAVASRKEVALFLPPVPGGKRSLTARISGKLVGRRVYAEKPWFFNPEVLSLGIELYLEGFYQDERYFADIVPEIRRLYHLTPEESLLPTSTRELAAAIGGGSGICLNVRRGDYVNHPHANKTHGVCTMDYYLSALAELRARGANGRVFVFSDDEPWARENFKDPAVFTIVGEEHAGDRFSTKFWLMTLCRHFIIPNSSFAWWAAWLGEGEGKLVARPSQWSRAEPKQDICPASWIRVENTF